MIGASLLRKEIKSGLSLSKRDRDILDLSELDFDAIVRSRILFAVVFSALIIALVTLSGCGDHRSEASQGETASEGSERKSTHKKNKEGTPQDESNADRSAEGTQSEQVTPVEAIEVTEGRIYSTVSAVAVIEPTERASVRALTTGIITTLKVEEGDRVKPKQLLAQITRPGAKSLLRKASVAYQHAKRDAQRLKGLSDKGLIPKEEWRRATFQKQQNALELQRLRQEATHEKIKSPIRGVIAQRSIYQGESVSPGQALFEVVDLREVRVPLFLPEQWAPQLMRGLKARLYDRQGALITDRAEVTYVSPIVDSQSGTIKVFLSPPKKDKAISRALKPGRYVNAEVILDTVEEALLIPRNTLMYKKNRPTVAQVIEGVTHLIKVETGYTYGEFIQIKSPLKKGDLVVSFGQRGLKEGAKVNVTVRQ